jgi:phosphate transport system substrate-binding protein
MDGRPFGPNVSAVKTNPEVFKAVAENKNAMGVIGVSWVSSDMKGREHSVEELAKAVEKSDTTMLDFNHDVKCLRSVVMTWFKPTSLIKRISSMEATRCSAPFI